jgi:YebC/PmpR family DNA-binding regulatory protein
VDKALGSNMPKATIDRACKRGSGELGGESYDEIRYEGYGPGGVAVIAECMTDNRNRTVSEVRHAFTKAGGNLGTYGSVAYMFNQIGVLTYASGDEDTLMEAALDAGAEDVIAEEDGSIEVLTDVASFTAVNLALTEANLSPDDAEVTMRADNLIPLDATNAEKLLKLVDVLEELDDVQEVFTNADIPDEVIQAMDSA